jgi:gliding motility-associated-like protein
MHQKNYPIFSLIDKKLHRLCPIIILFLEIFAHQGMTAQIYSHNFGTTAISTHPYTIPAAICDPHISNSSWTNATGSWTSNTGSTGEAIRLTTTSNTTITLTFDIANNFQADITSFDFWRLRSNFGPQDWSMTINGINVGNGTIGITGAAIGNTAVANPVTGLTGTVTVVISLGNTTGNGTFRLDDFTLNGTVTSTCTAATITSFLPMTGPQNTLVTINGSGFMAGSGTSAVKFNNIAAGSFTVVSDNAIKAYLPAGNTSGTISVTTNGCEGFSAGSFTPLVSVANNAFSSDIYISELYDAQAGDGGVIEIYNGTANPVNLSGYTIRRYGDVGGPTFYTINLTGIIPTGGIFLVGIGTGVTPCSITENQHYGTGFNSNDEFQLYNGSTMIDNVHAPVNVGYSVIRNPNALAPKPVFNPADWNTQTTESCANIGIHNPVVNTPPAVTSPTSAVSCENNSVTYTAALANPAGFTYQWKAVDASGIWVNVPNSAPYSGATSNTLTINPVPASFDENQYYCELTSTASTVVTNAAQLAVNPVTVPDFATTLSICNGAAAPTLNTTSPNGISGTWSPASINNTTNGSYVFTPTTGQCASSVTLNVTVNNATTPDFVTTLTLCSGETTPILQAISPNGISGTWNPSTISNTTSGSYIFTPDAGQCANSVTLNVTINSRVTPDFATALALCAGDTTPTLQAVSPNGISGIWSPSVIDNTASDNYVFTPNAGQCANSITLSVTVNPLLIADFPTTLTICNTQTAPSLNPVSPNGISGTWSPASINNTANGSYVFTPTTGQCASSVTLNVTVNNVTTPDFATTLTLCSGDTAPILQAISPNGISGTWNPTAISNTTSGSYIFTPDAGQCASSVTLNVTVNNATTPDFATTLTLCSGDTAPILQAISPNGISGTWNPSTINNTANGSYVFTPTTGQCASSVTLNVTVNNVTTPDFATTLTLCSGETTPILQATSPNGISGTWSPSTINNTTNGSYVFTPTIGQCASSVTLNVTVNNATTPDFATTLTLCSGETTPILQSISPNGISGTWNPTAISNTTSGSYIFTPDAGQCANSVTLNVTINTPVTPDFATALTLCAGDTAPILQAVSPNGISGIWSPSVIDNTASDNYVFTPNAGQCANSITLSVTVNPLLIADFPTTLTICNTQTAPSLNPVSPNGISGTWSPSTINNTANGSYVFMPTVGQCASSVTLNVTVTNTIIPDFPSVLAFCNGAAVPALNAVSPNGISGTWNPTTISNTANGAYLFTPNPGQCAGNFTLNVAINNTVIPDFTTAISICNGDTVPILNAVSPNGISGTWNPSTIDNTHNASYIFTPNPGQCASSITLNVTVNNRITPDFTTTLNLCSGNPAPTLQTVSPNGISGTWNPSTINNTTNASYIFTPNAGQCANSVTLNVTTNSRVTPDFNTSLVICSGTAVPALQNTSPNGISGTWNPATINNTASGSYTFTPATTQCADSVTLSVTVNPATVPSFATSISLCEGDTAAVLGGISPNGITGTWNPPTISNTNSGTYLFTPTAGQCATQLVLTVTVNPLPEPVLDDGYICIDQSGQVVNPALLDTGISGSSFSFGWTLDGNPLPATTATHLAVEPGHYQVIVTNLLTGCSATAAAQVAATPMAKAYVVTSPDFSGNPTITVMASGGSGVYGFQLDGNAPQQSNQFLDVSSGTHTVTFTDRNGCTEITLPVFILDYPRFFTPNDDGYNDFWNIGGLSDQRNSKIYIFDRYGKLLKALKPSDTSGWDGTFNGNVLPSTDYWFKLYYQDSDGADREFESHFSLKR